MADDNEFMRSLFPVVASAIKMAENDPTGNFGIRSIKPEDPNSVLSQSINNNYMRWVNGKTPAPWIQDRPERFVDFMQRRWAPVGAENDPNGLNRNWANNVRSLIKRQVSPEEYERMRKLKFVKAKRNISWA